PECQRVASPRADHPSAPGVTLVVGPFAAGALNYTQSDLTFYCDLTREEIIRRQTSGGLRNLGDDRDLSPGEKYKIGYYVEWPLLEDYKRFLLREVDRPVDFYVDANDDDKPAILPRELLLEAVADVSSRPFRCKPFFMPGVWGGQRMKEVAQLPAEYANSAWDFEIVAPENGIILGIGGERITIPFHLLMWFRAQPILGDLAYRYFGEYFPIRFDYLDTMQGTNLSLQVHPHHSYIRQHFNEPFAQDESYYIVENEPGAKVYLGLKEGMTRERLWEAVHRAETEFVPFDIAEYVNAWDAQPGDLFLIPSGTVHCSGANNLVLEISSTPYWYTFKIYDYLRPDLNGKPRPINSAHGFEVIDFTRTTRWVRQHLIPSPILLRQDDGGAEYHLGSHFMTFYGINRLHIQDSLADDTGDSFYVITVVKGDGVRILSDAHAAEPIEVAYLETYVIPAAFGRFHLQRIGNQECQVVKAYVKR
ncbi:MAG: class I mannose-6-phosphate isomerase, partial [Bacteroidota bacterium]